MRTVRTNSLMDGYLEELGYDFWSCKIALTTGLDRIINSPFVQGNDLLIINSLCQSIPSEALSCDKEKCEFEDSANHYHIDDYVPNTIEYNDVYFLGLGLEFLKRLEARLHDSFPQEKFRLTLSYGKVEDEDVKEFGNCVVRFYKVRSEAEDVFRIENLNDFKMEGVMEVETHTYPARD